MLKKIRIWLLDWRVWWETENIHDLEIRRCEIVLETRRRKESIARLNRQIREVLYG